MRNIRLPFLFLSLYLWAGSSLAAQTKNHIPPIAHIAGFTVGVDTIPQMSKRFGPAQTFVGFHSNSNNLWEIKRDGLEIHANYDNLSVDREGLTDDINISGDGRRAPDRAELRSFGLMGLVLPGMPKSEALTLLRRRLPAPSTVVNGVYWTMAGRARIGIDNSGVFTSPTYYTTWTLTIVFKGNRVVEIYVDCAGRTQAPPENRIPPIARLAGFTVGVNTIEAMEHRFGPGLKFTGEHPRGGRIWWSKRARMGVEGDGFDYNDNGRLINQIDIYTLPGPFKRGPGRMHARRDELTFMGNIRIGMTKSEALRLLKGRVLALKDSGDQLSWEMKGFAVVNPVYQDSDYSKWYAEMDFVKGRLDHVRVWC